MIRVTSRTEREDPLPKMTAVFRRYQVVRMVMRCRNCSRENTYYAGSGPNILRMGIGLVMSHEWIRVSERQDGFVPVYRYRKWLRDVLRGPFWRSGKLNNQEEYDGQLENRAGKALSVVESGTRIQRGADGVAGALEQSRKESRLARGR